MVLLYAHNKGASNPAHLSSLVCTFNSLFINPFKNNGMFYQLSQDGSLYIYIEGLQIIISKNNYFKFSFSESRFGLSKQCTP